MNQFPSVSSFSNKKFEKTKPAIVILSAFKTDITKCGVSCSISYCSGKEIGHEKKLPTWL